MEIQLQVIGAVLRAVAEEMSEEAVRDRGRQESIALRVARQLGLAHRYCDPETAARDRLGIREESDLHLDAFFEKSHGTKLYLRSEPSTRSGRHCGSSRSNGST